MKKIFNYTFAIVMLIFCTTAFTSCQEVESVGDAVLMTGTANDPMVKFVVETFPASYSVSASSTVKMENDTNVSVATDLSLVDAYNAKNGTNYFPIPEGSYTFEGGNLVIPRGAAISSAINVTITNDADFVPGRVYLIPITIKNADATVLESGRTIYLKVSRTLHFAAPNVANGSMSYQFLLPNPIPSLPVFTFEFKLLATQFRNVGASGTTRVVSFGGSDISTEGNPRDEETKCDQILIRFGEGTDAPNIMQLASKQGKMSSNTAFATNRWYSVAVVNNGNTMTLYVDGEKDNSMSVAPYEYALYGVMMGMASQGYQSSQLFYGRLAEMRLWTRALSPRELKANVCGCDPSTPGLVSYWRMNEGEGNTYYDLSPNKRDIAYKNGTNIPWTSDDYNKCVE